MKIIVPMAGSGQRFIQAGYASPKPLIQINGRRMIEHVLDMFSTTDQFVFICNDTHLRSTNMAKTILSLKPDSSIVSIPAHKFGPVFTVAVAYPHIQDDEPVIISYCDGTLRWDRATFERHAAENNLDGCLFTHTGFHPHALSSTRMAFLRERDGAVLEIIEKASFTDNPASEHASSGVYWFRTGQLVKQYFERMLREAPHNGEYYVTLVYNLMIRDGLRVGYFDTDHVAILGTPEEVDNFEAWATILGGHQVRNEADALRCYQYWKKYHD